MSTHKKYSPSSSDRWLGCPGSVSLIESTASVSKSSEYAEEGTKAHACLEFFLKHALIGGESEVATRAKASKKWSDEMIDHAIDAMATILLLAPAGSEILSETKADCSHVHPDFGGTTDAAAIDEFGVIHVFDYKYGAGVAVDAEGNTQMLAYAVGLAAKYHYNFKSVCMTIIQPRAHHAKGPVRSWVIPIAELMDWETRFKNGIAECEDPLAPLVAAEPGGKDYCRWCPAAAHCPEISSRALKTAQVEFREEPGVGGTNAVLRFSGESLIGTPETLGRTLAAIDKLETWIEHVKSLAFQKLSRGEGVPGWKLVQKQARRQWIDEDATAIAARKKFKEKAFSAPKLLTPAQMEKLAGQEWVNPRVKLESSGLKLAPESDRGLAVNPATSDFSDDLFPSETVHVGPERVTLDRPAPGSKDYNRSKRVSPKLSKPKKKGKR